MRVVYFNCPTGFSLEGALASLIGAGADRLHIEREIKKLDPDFKLNVVGTVVIALTIKTGSITEPNDFIDRIKSSSLTEITKKRVIEVLDRLSSTPVAVSDTPEREENLRAVTTVVGICLALEQLEIGAIYISPILLNALYPRPAAIPTEVLELLRGFPVIFTTLPVPPVTPIAAAFISALCSSVQNTPPIKIENTGCGQILPATGQKAAPLQAVIGTDDRAVKEHILVFETAIDDMNPEFYPFLIERLMESGALDVYLQPVIMKKGRPGILVKVLAEKEKKHSILDTIFSETSTLGIRIRAETRTRLQRRLHVVQTPYGPVRVKLAFSPGSDTPLKLAPEFEDCRARAREKNVSLQEVYFSAVLAAEKEIKRPDEK